MLNKKNKKKLSNFVKFIKQKRMQSLFLGLILFYGFLLRVIKLDYMSMWIDETISASAAKAILSSGLPLFETGYVYARAWLFHYFMSFFIWVFGGDFGARFISVIFGVLTIYLAYLFGQRFFKGYFGKFAFALLIALSLWEVVYSKQARFYQAFQFFYFLSFYLFYKFVILKEKYFSKRVLDYVSLVVVVLLAIHLQFMGYAIVPLLFLTFVIHNFSKDLFKKWWFWGFLGLSLIVGVYLVINLVPEIVMPRVNLYLLNYFYNYFGEITLGLLALLGLIISLYKSPKPHLSLALYTLLPVFGLIFMKYFATRYAYFMVFAVFFYVVALFNEVKFKYLLFVLFIVLQSSLFVFTGVGMVDYDASMPVADYKEAYNYIEGNVSLHSFPLVVTWSPAAYWYYGSADYQINYSLSGTGTGFWRAHEGGVGERFLGAVVVNSADDLPSEYVLVIDAQSRRKIPRGRFDFSECYELFSSYSIRVLKCSS